MNGTFYSPVCIKLPMRNTVLRTQGYGKLGIYFNKCSSEYNEHKILWFQRNWYQCHGHTSPTGMHGVQPRGSGMKHTFCANRGRGAQAGEAWMFVTQPHLQTCLISPISPPPLCPTFYFIIFSNRNGKEIVGFV